MGCRRRRCGRRVVTAVVGRENAELKFIAHAGVGRIGRRPLQIRRVLDGQQPFVKVGGIGVFLAGGIFRAAFGGLLGHAGSAQTLPRVCKCLRFGIGPALEFQRGQVRRVLHGREDDVGAAKK